MKIKRFEELGCWKAARNLNRLIYEFARRQDFAKDYRLSGQMTGASISAL